MKKNNVRVKGYKLDFTKNTFTMNYSFASMLNDIGSEEYKIFKTIREDFPQLQIITESGRKQKTTKKNKGLTYENMMAHISAYENSEELMEQFETVKEMSRTSASPYKYVLDWFKAQFPNYREVPNFDGGRTIVSQPIESADKAVA